MHDRPSSLSGTAPSLACAPRADWRFAALITTIYAAALLFLVLQHEPWRDEADIWVAVRDMNLRQLFTWLGGEGSPGLWHLILMPFAKAGAPYFSMMLIHAAVATSVVFAVASLAPFSRLIRCLIVFSFHFSVGYAVIARTYVLTVLMLVLITIVYTRTRNRTWLLGMLVLLLANANVHGFFMAGMMLSAWGFYLLRSRSLKSAGGFCLGSAGALLAFLQLLPPPDAQAIGGSANWYRADAFTVAFFPTLPTTLWLDGETDSFSRLGSVLYSLRVLVSISIVVWAAYSVRHRPAVLYVWVGSTAALFYIFVFRWFQGERHAGLLFVMTLMVIWIGESDRAVGFYAESDQSARTLRRVAVTASVASLLISIVAAGVWAWEDIRLPYSGAKDAAAFILANQLERRPIAVFPDAYADPVIAYFPSDVRFFLAGRQTFGSYTIWDNQLSPNWTLPSDEFYEHVTREFPERDCLILRASAPLSEPEKEGFRLIYETPVRPIIEDEVYYLYEPIRR